MRAYPENRITLAGYTDSTGSDAYNAELLQPRAQNVATFLIHSGVSPMVFAQVQGYGETQPIAPNTVVFEIQTLILIYAMLIRSSEGKS